MQHMSKFQSERGIVRRAAVTAVLGSLLVLLASAFPAMAASDQKVAILLRGYDGSSYFTVDSFNAVIGNTTSNTLGYISGGIVSTNYDVFDGGVDKTPYREILREAEIEFLEAWLDKFQNSKKYKWWAGNATLEKERVHSARIAAFVRDLKAKPGTVVDDFKAKYSDIYKNVQTILGFGNGTGGILMDHLSDTEGVEIEKLPIPQALQKGARDGEYSVVFLLLNSTSEHLVPGGAAHTAGAWGIKDLPPDLPFAITATNKLRNERPGGEKALMHTMLHELYHAFGMGTHDEAKNSGHGVSNVVPRVADENDLAYVTTVGHTSVGVPSVESSTGKVYKSYGDHGRLPTWDLYFWLDWSEGSMIRKPSGMNQDQWEKMMDVPGWQDRHQGMNGCGMGWAEYHKLPFVKVIKEGGPCRAPSKKYGCGGVYQERMEPLTYEYEVDDGGTLTVTSIVSNVPQKNICNMGGSKDGYTFSVTTPGNTVVQF